MNFLRHFLPDNFLSENVQYNYCYGNYNCPLCLYAIVQHITSAEDQSKN